MESFWRRNNRTATHHRSQVSKHDFSQLLDFVGVSGQAYRYGISVGNFDWIGSVPAMLLAAFIFIPYFWRGGMYTIPEYLGKRFNRQVRTIASVTWIIFFAVSAMRS